MTTPVRLRLSRKKGFELQAHSRAVNGLPAVNVQCHGQIPRLRTRDDSRHIRRAYHSRGRKGAVLSRLFRRARCVGQAERRRHWRRVRLRCSHGLRSHYVKPICVPCQRFYRPKRNGFYFIEGMPTDGAKPGLAERAKWKPYKLWCGDMWECPDCKAQIISGVAHSPIAEHYQPNFAEETKAFGADQFQVNDC